MATLNLARVLPLYPWFFGLLIGIGNVIESAHTSTSIRSRHVKHSMIPLCLWRITTAKGHRIPTVRPPDPTCRFALALLLCMWVRVAKRWMLHVNHRKRAEVSPGPSV